MHREAILPRVTTWLVLVAYVLVVSGLPLPFGAARVDAAAEKRLAAKDRSRPFPCMDKPCGCATAEQCFTRCCCNTPAETLAWARAHRVDMAVLKALEQRVAAVAAPLAGCCATQAAKTVAAMKPSCCVQGATTQEHATGLCGEFQPQPAAGGAEHDLPADQPGSRVVVLRAMLACGGIVAQWFTAAVSLPPPKLTLAMSSVMVGRFTLADDEGSGLQSIPEPRPPRSRPG